MVYNVIDKDILNDLQILKNELSIDDLLKFNTIYFDVDDVINNLILYNSVIDTYKTSLEYIINNNILRVNNVEKITTYEEFINRISYIYKNINFEYFKKLIIVEELNEYEKFLYKYNKDIIKIFNIGYKNVILNLHIKKLLNIYKNFNIANTDNILVKQALNYIYIKTNYVFIDIL